LRSPARRHTTRFETVGKGDPKRARPSLSVVASTASSQRSTSPHPAALDLVAAGGVGGRLGRGSEDGSVRRHRWLASSAVSVGDQIDLPARHTFRPQRYRASTRSMCASPRSVSTERRLWPSRWARDLRDPYVVPSRDADPGPWLNAIALRTPGPLICTNMNQIELRRCREWRSTTVFITTETTGGCSK
jgi:hypothetical protein